jgi:hypothetical protein
MRACNATHADCNSDLDFGTMGNGCETELTADLANCGGCGLRCDQPADSVAACDNRQCIAYSAHVGASSPGANALHGSPTGGNPFDQACGADELMVGFDGGGDAQNLFGMATLCAHATLRGKPDALELVLGEPRVLQQLGNMIGSTTMQATTRYQCKPGEVVTAVSGGLWVIPVDPPIDQQSVKQLTVACAKVTFDRNRVLTFTSSASLGAGTQDSVVATFSDACQAGEIVSGFKGRAGAGIDAVQTQCAPLQASQQSAGSTP